MKCIDKTSGGNDSSYINSLPPIDAVLRQEDITL